jgi:rhamnosyltransferase
MTRPKVLVLLAAYNGAKWIAEQVDSILDQANVDVRLVISDDGSTDDTLGQVARFADDERVIILSPPARTGSAAQHFLWLIRNTPADGFAFISFADQDDIWHKDKLIRGCLILKNSDAVGYSCAVTAHWSDGRERTLHQSNVLTNSDFLFEGAGQGCTFVLSVDFYCRLRVFFLQSPTRTDDLHYHDWAVYALSRSWNLAWVFDERPMMKYRQHASNDTGARISLSGIRKRLSLLNNGWYLRQLFAIAELCFTAAPSCPIIAKWHRTLFQPRGCLRTCRIAWFCLRGGRRRISDRIILVGAVLADWV